VAKSIQTFGFNVPILYDQNFTIIAGHTRWKAAQKLGMTHVPAIMLDLNDSQRKAFSVADNKLASLADWDEELVTKILEELKFENFDLSSLGYSEAELEALMAPFQDFNWEEFNEYLTKEMETINAVLQFKIKLALKDQVITAIKQYALKHGMKEKDSAVLAGNVLCHLLGVNL
jgi:ParB-like chromosome segregation protein Spo0J